MPKTKTQKQKEAIDRKLKIIPKLRQQYHDSFPGGTSYKTRCTNISKEHADAMLVEARKRFERACKEAHVDTHGNPLEA